MIRNLVVRMLRDVARRIEDGSCEMSEAECIDLMNVLSHEAMSKEKACLYLNMSRSSFDSYIRQGIIPKGRKRAGWKELAWYRDELDGIKLPI